MNEEKRFEDSPWGPLPDSGYLDQSEIRSESQSWGELQEMPNESTNEGLEDSPWGPRPDSSQEDLVEMSLKAPEEAEVEVIRSLLSPEEMRRKRAEEQRKMTAAEIGKMWGEGLPDSGYLDQSEIRSESQSWGELQEMLDESTNMETSSITSDYHK